MINVKYYVDKADKSLKVPIHLVIRQKDVKIKVSTGEKIQKKDWNNKAQLVKETEHNFKQINDFLTFLKHEVERHFQNTPHSQFTDREVKAKIQSIVKNRQENLDVRIVNEQELIYGEKEEITFIDLFAGAGGFSEGFLQAELDDKLYDFLLGSDINENCELTHVARYNYQLGLDAEFLRQDITEPDFLDNLIRKLNGQKVDVVCGGPPCQSFSLAGRRKKHDKKDDLFAHYLDVIRSLRPKYFIMENVKGLLTKEGGKVREMILQEIRSIVDINEIHKLFSFLNKLILRSNKDTFILNCYILRLQLETLTESDKRKLKEDYIKNIEKKFRILSPKIADYKTSKTNIDINTIRHGFNLLKRGYELTAIRKNIIIEKANSDLDNDHFTKTFDNFLNLTESTSIVNTIHNSIISLKKSNLYHEDIDEIVLSLKIFNYSFDECINGLMEFVKNANMQNEFEKILSQIRLYNIDKPFVALASDYGVPQNRERVLFIGCRKDQQVISKIPPTVSDNEKVTVYEALYDLDFLNNNDESFTYDQSLNSKPNGKAKKRSINGAVNQKGNTYAEWSRKGRLSNRFDSIKNPFYVRNSSELENPLSHVVAPLHNHKTSNQSDTVIERLQVILNAGSYELAKTELNQYGLNSDKRNYNVLNAGSQSPTIMTMPDDYIHYSKPRALTVREMARLQSFDDSFVFQGKRSTGGNKRKFEVPQFTLVGNAVPPLLARAVAMEVLRNIK